MEISATPIYDNVYVAIVLSWIQSIFAEAQLSIAWENWHSMKPTNEAQCPCIKSNGQQCVCPSHKGDKLGIPYPGTTVYKTYCHSIKPTNSNIYVITFVTSELAGITPIYIEGAFYWRAPPLLSTWIAAAAAAFHLLSGIRSTANPQNSIFKRQFYFRERC